MEEKKERTGWNGCCNTNTHQVLQIRKNYRLLTLLTILGLILTYVVGHIVNNLKLTAPDTFCRQYLLPDTLNIENKKRNLTHSLGLYFYLLYLGEFLNMFFKLPDQS